MDAFFIHILGKMGTAASVALLFFFYAYKNSEKLFKWFEEQTYGTRDYVMNKCELIHYEIEERKITYILLLLIFGPPVIFISSFSLFGYFGFGFFLGVVFGFVGWKLPRPFMDFLEKRRQKQYEQQMVDGLNLLSNGLRAGLSLPQSLGMVIDELPAPISEEFNLVLQQNKIGVPLEECFEDLVRRVPTEDNEMFVTSVNILRETGGNLSEVFDTITDIIRERIRLKQKIEAFVAQGKFQGGTIFSMPFILLIVYSQIDPDNFVLIWTHPAGIIMMIVALGLNLLGGYMILKVTEIKA